MTDHEHIIRRLDHIEGCLLAVVRDALALSRECVALLGKSPSGGMTAEEEAEVTARVKAQGDKLAGIAGAPVT